MEESQTMQRLLTKSRKISLRYETLAQTSGARFNVFRILGLEYREVRTHSRFLAEFLNPAGSHGLGSMPLEKFLEIAGIPNPGVADAKVHCEFYIGPVHDDPPTGGRIDILICCGNFMMAIENKIYAGDQHNQLLRYYKYLESQKVETNLIYLTLDGCKSDEIVSAISISYAEHIIKWLTSVMEMTIDKPLVRESLQQYINLIKSMTNQSEDDKMTEEIVDLICSDNENLAGFLRMYDSYGKVLERVSEKYISAFPDMGKTTKMKPEIKNIPSRYGGVYYEVSSAKLKNLKIAFEFQYSEFGGLIFGFVDSGSLKPDIRAMLANRFEQNFGRVDTSEFWPAYAWVEPSDGRQMLLKLNSPTEAASFHADMAKKLEILVGIVDQVEATL